MNYLFRWKTSSSKISEKELPVTNLQAREMKDNSSFVLGSISPTTVLTSSSQASSVSTELLEFENGKFIINIIDGFVPTTAVQEVQTLLQKTGFTYGWKSNDGIGFGHWNHVFGGYQKLNRTNIYNDIPFILQQIWMMIVQSQYIPSESILIRCYANAHTYGVEGYPHTDSEFDKDLTAVLYLNTHWKKEWAGETTFFLHDEIISAVLPKHARLLIFTSSLSHVARSVTRICPDARTVVVFKAMTTTRLKTSQHQT